MHVTDPTNAGRTMLMNLSTLDWDDELLAAMEVPRPMLPRIVPSISAEGFGRTHQSGLFRQDIPIAGVLGDQQAALVGQTCFSPGESKNTYGTGCFMLLNTGEKPIASRHGLLTTVAYQQEGERPMYALEGSVAVAGSLVQWLRDNVGIIATSAEIEPLANSVADNGGVYIVPAFSGLFAPHWRPDARGIIAGLTAYATKAHLAKAALEATAYQTKDVLDAMRSDSSVTPAELRVDGGMAVNDNLDAILKPTCSACRCCDRRCGKPPPSGPPSPRAWRWDSGPTPMNFAAPAGSIADLNQPCPKPAEGNSTPAGAKR